MTSRATLLPAAVSGAVLLAQSPPTTQRTSSVAPRSRDVSYVDVTTVAGLAGFRHVSGSAEKSYLIETTGSGRRDGRLRR